jgi:transglutaminase-like putative cysteine protease
MQARQLEPTAFLDFTTGPVRAFVADALKGVPASSAPRDKAVALFYAVRDRIRYDPYRISLNPETYMASSVVQAGHGWCVPKAVLLSACARAVGIPATVGLADVKNHLNTEKLRKVMQTDVFYDHGYSALWLDGHWIKAVPAFNIELCERFGVLPTEFDGRTDALYQPFNAQQQLHMEYLADHGTFDDLPLQRVFDDFARHYPLMMQRMREQSEVQSGDFGEEGAAERKAPGHP